jgi:hypothetical protein
LQVTKAAFDDIFVSFERCARQRDEYKAKLETLPRWRAAVIWGDENSAMSNVLFTSRSKKNLRAR